MTRPGGGNAKKHVNVYLLYARRPELYGLGTTSLVRGNLSWPCSLIRLDSQSAEFLQRLRLTPIPLRFSLSVTSQPHNLRKRAERMPSPACERAQRGRVVRFVVGQGRRQPGGRAWCPGKGSEHVWSPTPRERHTPSACRSLSFPFVLVVEPIRRVTAGLSRHHELIATARYYPPPSLILSWPHLAATCTRPHVPRFFSLAVTSWWAVGGARTPRQ